MSCHVANSDEMPMPRNGGWSLYGNGVILAKILTPFVGQLIVLELCRWKFLDF